MKSIRLLIICLALLLVFVPNQALAQEVTLKVSISRDFGYGGFGGELQGTLSLHAAGPETLVRVDFIMDGQVVATDTEPPFRFQFQTNQFAPGVHTMTAVGTLADGTQLQGNEIVRTFLTDEAANQATKDIVLPLLVGSGLVLALSALVPVLLSRKRKFTPGVYGIAGGAICPRCQLPFSRSFFAPNMLMGKLERCPHCGKWAIVPAASPASLAAAEKRLTSEGVVQEAAPETEEERLRKLLDQSKFDS